MNNELGGESVRLGDEKLLDTLRDVQFSGDQKIERELGEIDALLGRAAMSGREKHETDIVVQTEEKTSTESHNVIEKNQKEQMQTIIAEAEKIDKETKGNPHQRLGKVALLREVALRTQEGYVPGATN